MALAIEAIKPRSIPLPRFEKGSPPSPGFLRRRERITSSDNQPAVADSLDYENSSVWSLEHVFDDDQSEILEEHEIAESLAKRGLHEISRPDAVRFKIIRTEGKIIIKLTDLIEVGPYSSEKFEKFERFRNAIAKDPEILRETFTNKSQEYQDAIFEISEADQTYVIFISRNIKEPHPGPIIKTPFKVILTQIPPYPKPMDLSMAA